MVDFPPRGADEGEGLTGLDGEVDAAEDVRAVGLVAEPDLLELDLAFDGRQLDGARRLPYRRCRREQLAQLHRRGLPCW